MSGKLHEVQFDGLIGGSHNYSGLSEDNLACIANKAAESHPKRAALEGLAKMKALHDMGVQQAIIPPHIRPDIPMLRRLGYTGGDEAILENAQGRLLSAASSAAGMWVANAGTICPSLDSGDGKLHITVANLATELHRSNEWKHVERYFRAIFKGERFQVHSPLPSTDALCDEGAANHTRLYGEDQGPGLHIFVYGRSVRKKGLAASQKFRARQTLEASETLARLHGLDPSRVLFLQQSTEAIDAGVFHNDVICVGTGGTLLVHEKAFEEGLDGIKRISEHYETLFRKALNVVLVRENEVSLADAVGTYLFNSQLIALPDGKEVLILPMECKEHPGVKAFAESAFDLVKYIDVRESMKNGGGPACLRLRVPMLQEEIEALPKGIWLNNESYPKLVDWVERHYREVLTPADLRDIRLLAECRAALRELETLLGFENETIYDL